MNEIETIPADPDPAAQALLKDLAADEEYWDYLDQLELNSYGSREWDNAVVCGGAR